MKGSQDENFKTELKLLIIEECDLDIGPQDIPDDDPLFGASSCIGLDSIDALQISIAIQKKYGVVITDSKELRQVMTSFASFADHIRPE
jgi:acyl carrier protein